MPDSLYALEFRRGDTPTITWELDTDLDLASVTDIWFTISTMLKSKTWTLKNNQLIVDATNKTVAYTLTEKESLYFNAGEGEIQLRLLTTDSKTCSTDNYSCRILKVLNGGEMGE